MSALLSPGTIIDGRFEILARVGEGGMGQIYKARQIDLDRTVAVKVLFPSLVSDKQAMGRFEREGKVLSEIEHPNIPEFFKFGIWNGTCPYIAMEFLEGRSLQDSLSSDLYDWRSTIQILIGACRAVDYVHKLGFVHRDLKPANIVCIDLGETKTAKVVDFGLATALGERFAELTQSGAVLGTLLYMSPEQCQGRPGDLRADIYSLGCILYACLTGSPPFIDANPVALMHKHVFEKPNSLSKASRYQVPEALQTLVSKCLSKKPEDRPQSAAVLADSLEKFLEHMSDSAALRVKRPLPEAKRFNVSYAILSLLLVFAWAIFLRQSQFRAYQSFTNTNPNTRAKLSPKLVPWAALADAQDMIKAKKFKQAIDYLDRIIADHKDNSGASEALCFAHLQKSLILVTEPDQGQSANAEFQQAAKLLHLAPPSRLLSLLLFTRAKIEGTQGKALAAIEDIAKARRLINAPPGSVPTSLLSNSGVVMWRMDSELSDLLNRTGRLPEGISIWQSFLAENPKDIGAYTNLSMCWVKRGDLIRAEKVLLEGLEQRPEEVHLLKFWLRLLDKQGRVKAADIVTQKVASLANQRISEFIHHQNIESSSLDNLSQTTTKMRIKLSRLIVGLCESELERGNLQHAYELLKSAERVEEHSELEWIYRRLLDQTPTNTTLHKLCLQQLTVHAIRRN